MDKIGYLKTLEAVIAVVIVFGAILFLLPKNKLDEGQTPYELEVSAKAILDAVQHNPEFRKSVLDNRDADAINQKISETLSPFSPWTYAFSVCDSNNPESAECSINYIAENNRVYGDFNLFSNNLPSKNIYTKSVFLSYKDVTNYNIDEVGGEEKVIRLYFWEK